MYGIDVSTYQRTLNMNTVRDQGNRFVGVKAVAANRAQLARAADYENNVDRVMAAGLYKYPYTVPNNQNSPEATAAFTVANAYRRMPTDCWMLDNEPLDTFGVFWGDDEVYRYWTEMRTLGVDLARGIEYCPAALTRSRGRWTKLIKLREEWGLQIQWVSYGDNDPYYEDGEEPFIGNTGLVNPESHQFTSTYTVPGYTGLIDRVFSRLTVEQMFGTEGTSMPRTVSGFIAWAREEAATGRVLNDWAGWCEKFLNNGGAFNQAFASALLAGDASGPLRSDYENAEEGAIVYWAGVGGFGHVALIIERGPDPLLLMASSSVTDNWGHNIGTIRLSAYQRKFGHPLRGWTYRHGTETLNRSGTAGGGGTTPVDNNQIVRTIMPVYHWGPDNTNPDDIRPRGGVLLHEFLGPQFPSSAEEAQRWKEEYPPAGGHGKTDSAVSPYLKTDIDGRTWDVLVQSARNRNAAWLAQQAAAGGGDPDAIAEQVVAILGPQLVSQVVNGARQEVAKALEDLDVAVDIDYDKVEARAEQALRDVLGGLDAGTVK